MIVKQIIPELTRRGLSLRLTPARTIQLSGPVTDADRALIRANREVIVSELAEAFTSTAWLFVSTQLDCRVLNSPWSHVDALWIGIANEQNKRSAIEPRAFYRISAQVLAYLTRNLEQLELHWHAAKRGKGKSREREIGDPGIREGPERSEIEEAARKLSDIRGWLRERHTAEAWREIERRLRSGDARCQLPALPCKIELVKLLDGIGRSGAGARSAADEWVASWGR